MSWQFRLCLALLSLSAAILGGEYLYPVSLNDATAYIIYQKNPYHIELWEYDIHSKQAEQLLLSRCTPAGFRLLPSGTAFSFVDNGIIKIKNFLKRSARSLAFDAPLYQVELLQWIDDKTFYTSGKYRDFFGIFQIDYDGMVLPVFLSDQIDCMYPQKIGNDLFYVERDSSWRYRICATSYIPIDGETFQERISEYQSQIRKREELISFDQNPIIFLSMISSTEGYVVGHPVAVNRSDKQIVFDYYRILFDTDCWRQEKLFSFAISSDFLLLGSPARLYESILPLLPRHYGTKIIYTSLIDTIQYLHSYECTTGVSSVLADTAYLFPPIQNLAGGRIDDHLVGISMGQSGITMDFATVLP